MGGLGAFTGPLFAHHSLLIARSDSLRLPGMLLPSGNRLSGVNCVPRTALGRPTRIIPPPWHPVQAKTDPPVPCFMVPKAVPVARPDSRGADAPKSPDRFRTRCPRRNRPPPSSQSPGKHATLLAAHAMPDRATARNAQVFYGSHRPAAPRPHPHLTHLTYLSA